MPYLEYSGQISECKQINTKPHNSDIVQKYGENNYRRENLESVEEPSVHKRQERAWKEFESYLKKRNYRITFARKQIVSHIFAQTGHFRAEDAVQSLTQGAQRISRATVYATLELMLKAGIVRQIRDNASFMRYECVMDNPDHGHMICDCCGEFIEFQNPRLSEILESECLIHNFTPRAHSINIMGRCGECQKKLGCVN